MSNHPISAFIEKYTKRLQINLLACLCFSIVIFLLSSCSKENHAPSATITSFTPSNGVTGTTVLITGSNFSVTPGNNLVKFNGTTATVIASTGSSITAIVPVGSTNGTITVTLNGVTATSSSSFIVDPDLYLLGVNKGGASYYAYWKNGNPFNITGVNGAGAIAVSGPDVYITSSVSISSNKDQGAISKNGNITLLDAGATTQFAGPSAIFISGSDVFAAGWEQTAKGEFFAKYWKNGKGVVLSDTTSTSYSGKSGFATDIFVSGTDVYVGGNVNNNAVFWKNGVLTTLSTNNSGVNSIVVSNGDVYAAGEEVNASNIRVAKYWKNGVAVSLSDGTTDSYLSAIRVVNNDIYATGGVNTVATYWKNGAPSSLYSGPFNSSSFAMALSTTGDVYIALLIGPDSSNGYSTALWKNGILTNPFLGTNTWSMCLGQ